MLDGPHAGEELSVHRDGVSQLGYGVKVHRVPEPSEKTDPHGRHT